MSRSRNRQNCEAGATTAHASALVGRQAEMDAGLGALAGGSSGVRLVGDPGVGKTSLARAILGELGRQTGIEIVWMVTPASQPLIPFGAFAPFVPDIGGNPGASPTPFSCMQNDSTPKPAIAPAWAAAAEGALSDALSRLDDAAAGARGRHRAAMELLALHAGVRLGSGQAAARLAGNPRRATASAARAHSFMAGRAGPRSLALTLAPRPPGLTRRENEVARLAVRGLSSQAIATRLILSVRTVDTHLARVYFKPGISGRGELARALGSDGSDGSDGPDGPGGAVSGVGWAARPVPTVQVAQARVEAG